MCCICWYDSRVRNSVNMDVQATNLTIYNPSNWIWLLRMEDWHEHKCIVCIDLALGIAATLGPSTWAPAVSCSYHVYPCGRRISPVVPQYHHLPVLFPLKVSVVGIFLSTQHDVLTCIISLFCIIPQRLPQLTFEMVAAFSTSLARLVYPILHAPT
jgi:hypothetical protein